MPIIKNDRLLRAIWRQPCDVTPIWIMRQAGRYLPEYRAVREKAGSFMSLCRTPELACEVTLQPLRRFPLDAAILFSDILTIPDAMGLGVSWTEGRGIFLNRTVRSEQDLSRLSVPDPEDSLRYVLDAIRLIQHELAGSVPLIGFCGSPWTLAAYIVQGESEPEFPLLQRMQREEPLLLHRLLTLLAESVAAHLNAQISAGVDVVMLFDTWGGLLSKKDYPEFSLYYSQQVIAQIQRNYNNKKIPVILFTKNGSQWLETIADSGCDVVGVDASISLQETRSRIGDKVALQGNLDPLCLLQSPDRIREKVAEVLSSYGKGSGHIFNLGHGITPDVSPEHVNVLVEAVHALSRPYHVQD